MRGCVRGLDACTQVLTQCVYGCLCVSICVFALALGLLQLGKAEALSASTCILRSSLSPRKYA